MKKFILFCLFFIGLCAALFHFVNFQSLAAKGNFETILIDFQDNRTEQILKQDLEAIAEKYQVDPKLDNKWSAQDNVYIIKGDKKILQQLRKSAISKNTEFIEPNYIYTLPLEEDKVWSGEISESSADERRTIRSFPNDPMYNKQWNLRNINIEGAWKESKGNGVTVAVIDTGVTQVRDLKETKFVKGYDFVNDKVNANDDHGHGTHVAGTIAQSTHNSFGVAGVAYEASIMPLKVLSAQGGGSVADIAAAIKFAADNGADIINMSLGGGGESNLMKEAIEHAHKKGVTIIAAAGNENANGASYPARYPHVIGVSAIGVNGEKAPYSNFGAGVDISAPGGSEGGKILQQTIDPDNKGEEVFLGFQGTSMASPHVAGVAALIESKGVQEPNQVLEILQKSARNEQDDELNYYGAGQLNAQEALKIATQGQISFPDFFRWLRENGYLNPGFWIDGGAIALLPKILMVIGSYLLAWFLRVYFPFTWTWTLSAGLITGSSGLFFLKTIRIFDVPHWPLRLLGSSIPELGSTIQGTDALNPLFASVLIPIALTALLLGHPLWRWFAIGSTIGVASCLAVSAVFDPEVWGLSNMIVARGFLIINALLCFGLARLSMKNEEQTA